MDIEYMPENNSRKNKVPLIFAVSIKEAKIRVGPTQHIDIT